MKRRTSGAAYVSLTWLVVLIVLLLGAGGFLWMVSSEKTEAERERDNNKTLRDASDKKAEDTVHRLRDVSAATGFRDEADRLSESRPDEIAKRIANLQTTYTKFIGADANNLAKVIDRLQAQVDDLNKLLEEANAKRTEAETARASAEQHLTDMERQKNEANAATEKQLSDERDRHATQEAAEKARADDLNKRLTDSEARAKTAKDEADKLAKSLNEEIKKREGRIVELAKKTEVLRLPDQPDGSVVAVSTAGTCYVDLGTQNLLRRGTRFKVFNYGKGGVQHDKGMIEITKVEETMAEATVVDLKDPLDPLSKGDRIAAPNYDPKMPRVFVLSGNFPAGYTRALVADRLRALGATVQDKVTSTTDFLVIGEKGESTGAAAEGGGEAATEDAAEAEQMKLAQLYRVQVLPIRDLLDYVKFE